MARKPKILNVDAPDTTVAPETLPLVGDGHSTELSANADNRTVVAKFATKPSKHSPDRFGFNTVLDFGGCSDDEILALAAKTVVISVQRNFRETFAENSDAAVEASQWDRVDVKSDVIDIQRGPRGPIDRKRQTLSNMRRLSGDDMADVIAQLKADGYI